MLTQLRIALLAGGVMVLVAMSVAASNSAAAAQPLPAAGRATPRIPLDWEPDPSDASVPVIRCIGGKPRIVALKGGKKIRPRVRQTR